MWKVQRVGMAILQKGKIDQWSWHDDKMTRWQNDKIKMTRWQDDMVVKGQDERMTWQDDILLSSWSLARSCTSCTSFSLGKSIISWTWYTISSSHCLFMIKKKKMTTISKIWQLFIFTKGQSQPVRGGRLRHGRGGGKTIKVCKENNLCWEGWIWGWWRWWCCYGDDGSFFSYNDVGQYVACN